MYNLKTFLHQIKINLLKSLNLLGIMGAVVKKKNDLANFVRMSNFQQHFHSFTAIKLSRSELQLKRFEKCNNSQSVRHLINSSDIYPLNEKTLLRISTITLNFLRSLDDVLPFFILVIKFFYEIYKKFLLYLIARRNLAVDEQSEKFWYGNEDRVSMRENEKESG